MLLGGKVRWNDFLRRMGSMQVEDSPQMTANSRMGWSGSEPNPYRSQLCAGLWAKPLGGGKGFQTDNTHISISARCLINLPLGDMLFHIIFFPRFFFFFFFLYVRICTVLHVIGVITCF